MTANAARGSDLPSCLLAALREQTSPLAEGLRVEEIRPLVDTGLAHAHFRLGAHPVLARVPKQSQMHLQAQANLDYQRCCFERAAPSGHTPELRGVLPVSPALPRGALLVEAIEGRAAGLPGDLPAIMRALASLHQLAMPQASRRAPLFAPADPLLALLDEVRAQAVWLSDPAVPRASRVAIESVLANVLRAAADPAWALAPRSLIAFDAHPGNYLISHLGGCARSLAYGPG